MLTELPVLPGYSSSVANGINGGGAAAGMSGDFITGEQAVRWDAAGAVTALGNLPGGSLSNANDINDKGVIVGNAQTADGNTHAVRW